MKYRRGSPGRFISMDHARAFCRDFVGWYNRSDRHAGIGLMTPFAVRHGQAEQVHAACGQVLDDAYVKAPERFVNAPPVRPRCRAPPTSTTPPAGGRELSRVKILRTPVS